MNDYVISFYDGQDCKVIWSGLNPSDALSTFWASFDEVDKKKVSDVHIFKLIEVKVQS